MTKNRQILTVAFITLLLMITLSSCVSQKKGPGTNYGPSKVVNIYPSQSELIEENYFYSRWTKSVDPEGGEITYRINFARNMGELDNPEFFETKENYFLMPNLSEGVWYWRVTAMDDHGNSEPSQIWSFTVNGEGLPQPVDPISLPANPALIVSEVDVTSFTLDWPEYEDKQNPETAIQYTIYVYDQGKSAAARNTSADGYWMARNTPATTAHTTDTRHTFEGMNTETRYDWTIIAQNAASQTSVVGSSQLKTGNRPPSQPMLLNPDDEAEDVATNVTLSWTPSVDPDDDEFRYFVYMDTVNNTNRIVSSVEGIATTTFQPEDVEEGRTYYWFVMVIDENSAATRTQTRSFSTFSSGMGIPITPTPSDGATGLNATIPTQLQWQHDTQDAQVQYSIYLSKNPKKMVKIADNITSKAYQLSELLDGNCTYYWMVEARDLLTKKTTLSKTWAFTTDPITPPAPLEAETNLDGTQIEMNFSKAMSVPTGQENAFIVKREADTQITARGQSIRTTQLVPVSKIEMKPGTTDTYRFTLETTIKHADTVTVDYVPGNVSSTDKGKLAGFVNFPVINNVPGEAPIVEKVTATANTVTIKFDKDMKHPSVNAITQFSIKSGNTVKQIADITRTASDTYTLQLAAGQLINYGEVILLNYTKGTVQAENDGYLASFTDISVENTVAAPAPQFVSGETTTDGLTVKAVFDREMADPSGKYTQFFASVQGVRVNFTAVKRSTTDAGTFELTLPAAVENSQLISLYYTAGNVMSTDGATLASFENKPITNNVPAGNPICTAATMTADGYTVQLAFSERMRTPSAEENHQFGILVNGYVNEIVTSSLNADQRVLTLTLQKPVGKKNAVHLSYTKGTVSSTAGGLLESFQNMVVNTDALTIIRVSKDCYWNYATINDAIDGADDEDIILVEKGTYTETINFDGKAVTVKSNYEADATAQALTIIDGESQNTIVAFKNSEDRESILEGFTLINGKGADDFDAAERNRFFMEPEGGAITIVGASPTIRNNLIKGCNAESGAGIYAYSGNPLIYGNTFEGNLAYRDGGAIYLGGSRDNSSERMQARQSTATIYENTIKNNSARNGAGIYIVNSSYDVLNKAGTAWQVFNSPYASVAFVENTETANNEYSGNVRTEIFVQERDVQTDEGIDIYFNAWTNTPDGTLTLDPSHADENKQITLNMAFEPETAYHGGYVVFEIKEESGFEITNGAAVIIGNNAAVPITNFTSSATMATITNITLTSGKITLRLAAQATPPATDQEDSSARNIDYTVEVYGDPDGVGSIWDPSSAISAVFEAREVSGNTDISYVTGNEEEVQLMTDPTKSLKVASQTTVSTLLASIKASDDSSQTYEVYNSNATLTNTDQLTKAATLVVTATNGDKKEYGITINKTKFVRLYSSDNASSARNGGYATTWHDTIGEAVTDANASLQSTITVWPGTYVENVNFSSKPIHLTSTDPTSLTVRQTTIIDGDSNGTAILVNTTTGNSIVEGFTVKNGQAVLNFGVSSARGVFSAMIAAGIYVDGTDAIVRNNILSENGTSTGNLSGIGVCVEGASPTIYNNTIINNYNALGGAGIGIIDGNPTVFNNTITDNITAGYGGGIGVLDSRYLLEIMGQGPLPETKILSPKIYSNTINNNQATMGPGIFFYYAAQPKNTNNVIWKTFNAPAAEVTFVENTSSNNNSFSGNTLLGSAETVNIRFATNTTNAGTLTLTPDSGTAGELVSIEINYLIGREFHGGSLTISFEDSFEITADASVIIGENAAVPVSGFSATSVTLTNINLETGTVTLKLANQAVPGSGAMCQFNAVADADGADTAWTPVEKSKIFHFQGVSPLRSETKIGSTQ